MSDDIFKADGKGLSCASWLGMTWQESLKVVKRLQRPYLCLQCDNRSDIIPHSHRVPAANMTCFECPNGGAVVWDSTDEEPVK